jgi:group I intron endonuclease
MKNKLQNSKSYIYNAILKYGYSNLSLTIVEYCDKEQCIEREDFDLSSLQHEYNILPKAGSRLGHKHSDESKQKISDTAKKSENSGRFKTGHNHCEEIRTIMSEAKKGENNPMFDKPRPEGALRIFNKKESPLNK